MAFRRLSKRGVKVEAHPTCSLQQVRSRASEVAIDTFLDTVQKKIAQVLSETSCQLHPAAEVGLGRGPWAWQSWERALGMGEGSVQCAVRLFLFALMARDATD